MPRILGRFRRQLRRAAGTGYAPGQLSESQAELLRLVSHRPGMSVSVAAAELGLVPNTASTLVSKLSCAGLLERTTDPADRRDRPVAAHRVGSAGHGRDGGGTARGTGRHAR